MAFDKVHYQEMKDLIAEMPEKTTIIDVRERQEVEQTGVIGPSMNIPLAELKKALKKTNNKAFQKKYGKDKPGREDELIFYCLSENRAIRGADLVHSLGYKNLKILEGGWQEWETNEIRSRNSSL